MNLSMLACMPRGFGGSYGVVKNVKKDKKSIRKKYWAFRNWFRDKIFQPIWYSFFGHKFHIVKTKLTPAPWYDTDTRMLYVVMGLVEWFVENDQRVWSADARKEELDRIEKEEEGEFKKDQIEQLKEQWGRDDAIVDIYGWWKNYDRRQEEIREALNEWHSYVQGTEESDDIMHFFARLNELNKNKDANAEALSDKLQKLEDDLEKETQEMLKKAIDLRGAMWS